MNPEEYKKILKGVDWHYSRSDDFKQYTKGEKSVKDAFEAANGAPELEELFYEAKRRSGGIYFPTDTSLLNFMQSLTPDEQRLFAGGEI